MTGVQTCALPILAFRDGALVGPESRGINVGLFITGGRDCILHAGGCAKGWFLGYFVLGGRFQWEQLFRPWWRVPRTGGGDVASLAELQRVDHASDPPVFVRVPILDGQTARNPVGGLNSRGRPSAETQGSKSLLLSLDIVA